MHFSIYIFNKNVSCLKGAEYKIGGLVFKGGLAFHMMLLVVVNVKYRYHYDCKMKF